MVLFSALLFATAASAACYEASIAHSLPKLDPHDPVLKHAFASINNTLTNAAAAHNFASTSFSLEITSPKQSLWSKHHTARERNASRSDIPEVNGDALYRIASITKTFTVLGIIYQHEAGNLSLDDSVEKYIEELKEEQVGSIPWKDVTLRTLASQLSGIPRECTPVFTMDCYTEEDLLETVKSRRPLFAPNMKSTYSNIGYELLGLVLERVTNNTFEEYMSDAIFKPLKMSSSFVSLPPDSAGVIPLNPQGWDMDEGIQSPAGAIYSSATDLSKYVRYPLTHYNAIATGINWVHPVSPSEGLHSFYGMPWEILHTDRVLEDSKRTVRFITKSGRLPGYSSMIATIPDFDLGFTILVAGSFDMFPKILDAIGATIVRAADEVAIRQLEERYAGTYASTSHGSNSTITFVADKRGLVIERFISNGVDILENAFKVSAHSWYAQAVPTLLFSHEKKQKGEYWRAVQSNERTEGEGSIWDDFCTANIDAIFYPPFGFNELVFWDAENDKTFGRVELTAFKLNLTRTQEQLDSQSKEIQETSEL